jgi:1,4-dihydroxy-2-naphthoyl-CoA hydrolase
MEALGIDIAGVFGDELVGHMPVDARTHQIHGQLHGGASVALIETLGSLGATLSVDPERQRCVGLEVNANHVRAVRTGRVEGRSRALHLGRTTQVWETRLLDSAGRLVCVGRLTVAVLGGPQAGPLSP